MKRPNPAWLEVAALEICLSFKTMKKIKIADLVLTMNSFYH